MPGELRILFYNMIYPGESGSNARTFNLAKIASPGFRKTTVFAVDGSRTYDGPYHGVELVIDKKYDGMAGKYLYFMGAYFRRNFIPACSPRAFSDAGPDTVFNIVGPSYYPLLKKMNIKKYVLDEHNLYWELNEFAAYYLLKNRAYSKLTCKREYLNEIRAIENASHILACSERDRTLMMERVPSAADRITVVPNCVDFESFDDYARQYVPQRGDLRTVLFVGTYGYDPNIDALHAICSVIAPHVGPGIRFIAAGRDPPAIPRPDNVVFTGYVDDLKKTILDSDICIAPLRYGSGTRFKILEYMALGKPVISTSKGAEGIDYTDGVNIIIEDDLTQYPARIQELIDDKARMRRIGSGARELIRDRYDWKRYQGVLRRIYERVADEN